VLRLINQPCTLIKRVRDGKTPHGDPKWKETEVETVCSLDSANTRRADEPGDQGEFSDSEWRIFLRPDEDVSTTSAVIVDGDKYEFVGKPWRAWDPTRNEYSHIEVIGRLA
jgi:hypothetical protein